MGRFTDICSPNFRGFSSQSADGLTEDAIFIILATKDFTVFCRVDTLVWHTYWVVGAVEDLSQLLVGP